MSRQTLQNIVKLMESDSLLSRQLASNTKKMLQFFNEYFKKTEKYSKFYDEDVGYESEKESDLDIEDFSAEEKVNSAIDAAILRLEDEQETKELDDLSKDYEESEEIEKNAKLNALLDSIESFLNKFLKFFKGNLHDKIVKSKSKLENLKNQIEKSPEDLERIEKLERKVEILEKVNGEHHEFYAVLEQEKEQQQDLNIKSTLDTQKGILKRPSSESLDYGPPKKTVRFAQEERPIFQSAKPYLSNITKQGPSDFIQQLKKEQKRRGIAAQKDSNKPSLELSDAKVSQSAQKWTQDIAKSSSQDQTNIPEVKITQEEIEKARSKLRKTSEVRRAEHAVTPQETPNIKEKGGRSI
jgi:hypothetical protein